MERLNSDSATMQALRYEGAAVRPNGQTGEGDACALDS